MSTRTRNLDASNKYLAEFFTGRSWPKIGRGIVFVGAFEKFEKKNSKICAHSERYRNHLAGIFEFIPFYGNIAFPLSQVLNNFKVFRLFVVTLLLRLVLPIRVYCWDVLQTMEPVGASVYIVVRVNSASVLAWFTIHYCVDWLETLHWKKSKVNRLCHR